MQLIAILSALLAINLGIVYVGSQASKDGEPQVEGVVEVETVDAVEEAPAAMDEAVDEAVSK